MAAMYFLTCFEIRGATFATGVSKCRSKQLQNLISFPVFSEAAGGRQRISPSDASLTPENNRLGRKLQN